MGELPTEQSHPLTRNLDELSRENLREAFKLLKEVDLSALKKLNEYTESLERLRKEVHETLNDGGRIFLCGCGATGRLSLSIETLWRKLHPESALTDRVVSFMAGGDFALIKSIENFEDHPEYGARQLRDLGFSENDLLISTTEGGETPFVIGATEEATRISRRKPFFLYCNPDDVLIRHVERSRRVIENPGIDKIALFVGPMAISGSTRMQATTVLMFAAGTAVLTFPILSFSYATHVQRLISAVQATDYSVLIPLTEWESAHYGKNGLLVYQTRAYGITLLTDTTERSPTFSLRPFENRLDRDSSPSLCYIQLDGPKNPTEAWEHLLNRKPRALPWPETREIAGQEKLEGFDFGANALRRRKRDFPRQPHAFAQIDRFAQDLKIEFEEETISIPVHGLSLLEEHLLVKMLLNAHSTLTMGRLGRYEGNWMTWVKPTNYKLIDRSIRYLQQLCEKRNYGRLSYEEAAKILFETMPETPPHEAVIQKALKSMTKSHIAHFDTMR